MNHNIIRQDLPPIYTETPVRLAGTEFSNVMPTGKPIVSVSPSQHIGSRMIERPMAPQMMNQGIFPIQGAPILPVNAMGSPIFSQNFPQAIPQAMPQLIPKIVPTLNQPTPIAMNMI